MELMHLACDFLPLSKLSFLSSVHTTRHLVALKSYCEKINSSHDGGTSLISLDILSAPCSHAVSLIFSSFQPLFYSLHFSPLMPLPHFLTSSLLLYHLLILSPIALSPFHFFRLFFCFVFCSPPPLLSLQAHAYLSRYYREHNVELSKLLHRLGQPLPSWLREELQKVSSIKTLWRSSHQLINTSSHQ